MRYNPNFDKLKGNYAFHEINASAAAKRRTGAEVIDLGVGDVRLPLFDCAVSAMKTAAAELGAASTFHGYPPPEGLISLREKISRDYLDGGVKIDEDEIFVSDGAKSDLGNLLELFGPGAKVLISTPCYPAYAEANALYGNDVSFLPTTAEEGFMPYPPLAKKFDLIFLCSPNNPTGAAMTYRELKFWVDYALSSGAVIIFDGAYSLFAGGDALKTVYAVEGAKRCAIEIRSFSKSFGFTGVRCGYSVIPKELGEYNRLWRRRLGCRFNGVSYISQRGAEAFYSPEGRAEAIKREKYYKSNAEIVKIALKKKNLWYNNSCSSPYVFARCPEGYTSAEFCKRLLDEFGIVTAPGSAFGEGGEGYFRVSALAPREDILRATDKIQLI